MPDSGSTGIVDRITLDREVFKALASDTRLDILKALDVRQKTVTELARELDLNKATVFEHLEKLSQVELIQKLEDDRKWVYWQLSWKGRRLLHPEKITLALLLSTALGTLFTAFAAVWLWAQSNVGLGPQDAADGGFESRALNAPEAAPPTDTTPAAQHDPVFLATAVVLGLVFLALVGYAVLVWRKAQARRGMDDGAPPAA